MTLAPVRDEAVRCLDLAISWSTFLMFLFRISRVNHLVLFLLSESLLISYISSIPHGRIRLQPDLFPRLLERRSETGWQSH